MKRSLTFIILFSVICSCILTSCKKDKCAGVLCYNGGTCDDDGNCICLTGYDGARCEAASNHKFEGSYSVTNTCATNSQLVITGYGTEGLYLSGFLEINMEVRALVGINLLTIIRQSVNSADGLGYYTVSGSGELSGDVLLIDGTIIYTDFTNSSRNYTNDCIAICTKL